MGRILSLGAIGAATACGYASAALFLLSGLFIVYDVAGRWLFHAPTAWALELTTYAFMVGAFLGGPYALRRGEHVIIEFLSNALPRRARQAMHVGVLSLIVVLVGLVTWYAVRFAYSSYALDLRSPILHLPVWPAQGAVPLSFAVMLAEALRQLAGALRGEPPQVHVEGAAEPAPPSP